MTNRKQSIRLTAPSLGLLVGLAASTSFAQPAPAAPPPATVPAPSPAPAPAPAAAPAADLAPPPPPRPPGAAPVAAAIPASASGAGAPPPPPSTLAVGSGGNGTFQPSALLQFWVDWSHQDMKPKGATVPVADEKTFLFRLRRAELRVKGDIVPKRIAYNVMIDPARALEVNQVKADSGTGTVAVAQPPLGADGKLSPLTILADYFITFQSDYADVSLGQFKIPVSYEGYNAASKILFPERAPVSRYYGDKRDMGIRIDKKLGDHFYYSAGLFNGTGQNRLDDDTEKDGALRLEGMLEGLTVAGVGYTTIGKREKSSRDRLEADVKYDAHNVYVLAEYIHGWDTKGGGKATEGHGTYVEAAYTLIDHLQPMLRIGDVEPAMHRSGDHYWHYEGGVAWLFQKNEAKVTLAGAIYDPSTPNPPTNPQRTEVILAAQAAF
ncbi:MAG TPA: porin [Polyangiaceae bacterium]|nr:porin [Polyangiaceae bacterium]